MQAEEGAAKTAPTFKETMQAWPMYSTTSANITSMYAVGDFGSGDTTVAKVNKCPLCNCYSFEKDGIVYKLDL